MATGRSIWGSDVSEADREADVASTARLAEGLSGGSTDLDTMPTSETTVTRSQLDAELAALPFAEDGRVIVPDYHNLLRQAILDLAALTLDGEPGPGNGNGSPPTTREVVLPLVAAFVPNTVEDRRGPPGEDWQADFGYELLTKMHGEDQPVAWMPLPLPGGAVMKRFVVYGSLRDGEVTVEIRGRPLEQTHSAEELLDIDPLTTYETFLRIQLIQGDGELGGSEDEIQIDRTFGYILTATWNGGASMAISGCKIGRASCRERV